MKIGIITIHYSFITRNYGSLMQLYAMQQVLEGMSVQSALIKPVSYTHLTLPTIRLV